MNVDLEILVRKTCLLKRNPNLLLAYIIFVEKLQIPIIRYVCPSDRPSAAFSSSIERLDCKQVTWLHAA